MTGWSTKKGVFATEGSKDFYPKRSESAITSKVKLRLKYDPKDSTNQCKYESYEGFNVSEKIFTRSIPVSQLTKHEIGLHPQPVRHALGR